MEKTLLLDNVRVINCFSCNSELVVETKEKTTDYECCKCKAVMSTRFYKNGKVHTKMKKRGVVNEE